jgi:tellurite resistance protein TerC
MYISPYVWCGFLLFVVAMVMLDLGAFHRRPRAMQIREAVGWSLAWVALALAFIPVVVYLYDQQGATSSELGTATHVTGQDAALQYFTGYVLEKSLSVDNLFVMAMIFAYFRVPLVQQHRLLFLGILGALVLRGIMICLGAALIERFQWLVYVFGATLLFSAAKMLVTRHDNVDLDQNAGVRILRRLFPITTEPAEGRFFVRQSNQQWAATPLALALVLIETSDIMFAVDSIPAVFAVTRDPFLVFTSNIFAILGLRSLYFVLAGFMEEFRYLKMSLVFVLAYVGVKMLLSHYYPIPNMVSLAMIGGILAVGVIASFVGGGHDTAALRSPLPEPTDPTIDAADTIESSMGES